MSERIKTVILSPDLRLEFKLEPNEDMTLTCIICGFNRCSLGFMVRSKRAGKRSWYGVHKDCQLDHWLDNG